jgi:RNA polymerase sigma-70 factor (ECF subfamily)
MNPLRDPEPQIRRVYAYVAYRIGDGPEAEDVTSDVFERALRYRESYDPSKGPPIAWLLGIARRALSEACAARQLLAGDDHADLPAPGDLAEEVAWRLTLAAAVARLPDRDRELIALRYGADLTARQIGELLDLRTNAVEVALHRALARLRAELGEDEADHPAARVPSRTPVRVDALPAVVGVHGSIPTREQGRNEG